ncbi:MAG: phosphoribosyltransferase [DPANN group archaeon]|nr:phosphoribosyltransferase [DPANN group archaeon]
MSVGSFYEGKGIDTYRVWDIFMPYLSDIFEYGETDISSKVRYLRHFWYGVQKLGIALQENFDSEFKVHDVIVSVASGGFEPAYLIMHIMEKDHLFVLRYSTRRSDCKVQVFEKDNNYFLGENLTGQNVFVIDDVIEYGDSMFEVLKYVVNLKPSKLYGFSVFCRYITPLVPHIEKIGSKPFVFKYNLDS